MLLFQTRALSSDIVENDLWSITTGINSVVFTAATGATVSIKNQGSLYSIGKSTDIQTHIKTVESKSQAIQVAEEYIEQIEDTYS